MLNYFNNLIKLLKNKNNIVDKFQKNSFIYLNNLLNLNFLLSTESSSVFSNLEGSFLNSILLSIEHIKIQELTFLAEYYLITALFCLTLFSLKLVGSEKLCLR